MLRLALLLSLVSLAGAAVAEPLTTERRGELANLLKQDCGSCHGLTMKGGLGPPLLPGNLAGRDDAVLVEVILDGVPGTPMPPWLYLLDEDEAAWLVEQLRGGPDGAP